MKIVLELRGPSLKILIMDIDEPIAVLGLSMLACAVAQHVMLVIWMFQGRVEKLRVTRRRQSQRFHFRRTWARVKPSRQRLLSQFFQCFIAIFEDSFHTERNWKDNYGCKFHCHI